MPSPGRTRCQTLTGKVNNTHSDILYAVVNAVEKGMATHSRCLAWRIPWTEEPGRLQSVGSQSRLTHNVNLESMLPLVGLLCIAYFYFSPENNLRWDLGILSFPGGNPSANAGAVRDMGLIPGLERSLGEGNCYLLQYSCLENPMDRGAGQATVQGIAQTWTCLKQLSVLGICIL